jgi:hypothetical protein
MGTVGGWDGTGQDGTGREQNDMRQKSRGRDWNLRFKFSQNLNIKTYVLTTKINQIN